MNISNGLLMVAVASAALVAGCAQYSGGGSRIDTGASAREQRVPTALVGRADTPLDDIPVPLRFKLQLDQSRAYATSGIRMVDHTYTGSNDMWAVGRFYQRQMREEGWAPTSDQMVRGRRSLRFAKSNERCTIEITRGGWSGTIVNVQIYPEIKTPTVARP